MTHLVDTNNFSIEYDEILQNSRQCAEILSYFCELDFAQLAGWFNISSGFGPSNRILLQIKTLSDAEGKNKGYVEHQSSSNIMYLAISIGNGIPDNQFPDITRSLLFVLVAELSEIFMDYCNFKSGDVTWVLDHSDGEGLSQFCALELHFDPNWIVINTWLTLSDRNNSNHDWITQSKLTDGDEESYGLSLLFIYYLHFQLGKSIEDIIRHAGSTLEQTYFNLKGNSGGFNAMNTLLNFYYPLGHTSPSGKNNLFPLVDPHDRKVSLDIQINSSNPTTFSNARALVSPFPAHCPNKEYSYNIEESEVNVTINTSAVGYTNPDWNNATWYINGQLLGSSGTLTELVTAITPTPGGLFGEGETITSITSLFYYKSGTPQTLNIFKNKTNVIGNFTITVEIELSESSPADEVVHGTLPTRASGLAYIEQLKVVWEYQYYLDKQKCIESFLFEQHGLLNKNIAVFNVLKTLPDPAPEYFSVFAKMQEINIKLTTLAKTNPDLARKSREQIIELLKITPKVLNAFAFKEERHPKVENK